MFQRGLNKPTFAMPIHPWQFEHLFPKFYADDIADGVCHPLNFISKRNVCQCTSMHATLIQKMF